jgi:hypothetical protein
MKKLFLALFLLALPLVASGQSTPNYLGAVGVIPTTPPTAFGCSLQAIDATLTQCQAVPGVSTQSHYITLIAVQTSTGTSGTYALRSGTGTNCATETTNVFPNIGDGSERFNAPIAANGLNAIPLPTPIKVTTGHAICLIGVATNTIDVFIGGYTQ